MSDLSGKKALVTGAGMGIGQGIAVELARRGAEVAVHYAHTEPEETVSQIEEHGGKAATVQGDLSKVADCERTAAFFDDGHVSVRNWVAAETNTSTVLAMALSLIHI